jgi:serine protease Do
MRKQALPIIATAALTSVATVFGTKLISNKYDLLNENPSSSTPIHYVSHTSMPATQPVDFSSAAEDAVKSVVHIKTLSEGKTVKARDPFDIFGMYGFREYKMPDQVGSGSGVIISDDGYIITNNHVIAGATKVQVTFNDRNTEVAEVIGSDPSTDLAVLKINAKNLHYMEIGNSDDVKLGQWVLAVGYPLNLDATVTAGIVSAKGRALGINQRQSSSAIESFIQTDAAVNPGNSGGPLVNIEGRLIGINSAIASPTGSYAGYSYAIPSNIVEKVTRDIIKYGKVQRGYLGVALADLNDDTAEKLGINKNEFRNIKGVYVNSVEKTSGAEAAGIKKGDFITAINGTNIENVPQLQGLVARYHPGDKISVSILRDGKTITKQVELKASFGTKVLDDSQTSFELEGAKFRNLTTDEQKKFNVQGGGVYVEQIGKGKFANAGINSGFIIVTVNDKRVKNVAEFNDQIQKAQDGLQLGGIYAGRNGMYYYGMSGIQGENIK